MSDIFQFYSGSADAAPGKGSGEALESAADYKPLRAIAGWRRTLAGFFSEKTITPEILQILPLTHGAELWHGPPRKTRVRATDLEAQRNALVQEREMEAPVPKTKKVKEVKEANPKATKATKSKKAKDEAQLPESFSLVPENAVASEAPAADDLPPPDLEAEENTTAIRFCPVCRYYLYLQQSGDEELLTRLCRNCGYKEQDEKGGLVMEMMVQQRSAEGYKILLNEFTRKDPRLPHIHKNIKCPDVACTSNRGGAESDVIYIKYDAANLLYLYICDVCGYQWRSKR